MTKRTTPSKVRRFMNDTCLLCDTEFTPTLVDGKLTRCPTCSKERELAKARRNTRVKPVSQATPSTSPRSNQLAPAALAASWVTCPEHGLRHQQLVIDRIQVLGCPDCRRARWMQRMAEEDAAEAERLELAHARLLTEAGLLGWHARASLEDFQVDPEHSDAQEAVLVALNEFMDSFQAVGKG